MKQIELKSNHFVFVIQNHAAQSPNHLACTYLDEDNHQTQQLTYAELDKTARSIAAYLQQKDIFLKRVLVLYSTGIEFISAFLGCLYAGAIAVPVNASAPLEFARSKDLLNAIAQDADISCILTSSAYLDLIKTHLADLITTKALSIIDSATIELAQAEHYQLPDLQDDTIAYLQYTSGSTSAPKGVVTSHHNLAHSLTYTLQAWHYSKDSVTLTWAPHSHVYGLVCGLLLPLYHGTPAFVMRPDLFIRRPAAWLEAIASYRVTHSGCPNFGYDHCVQEIDTNQLSDINLKSWVVAVNGGESVQYQTLKQFKQKFEAFGFQPNHFNSAYGMSEVTGLIAATQYDAEPDFFDVTLEDLKSNKVVLAEKNSIFRKFVSSGDRLPGLEAAIVDPETLLPVRENGIGEIWLAGDSVASGYFRRPEETKNAFGFTLPTSENRYFRTGDLGFIRDGDLCITGRLKEVINIHGKKYYPLDIEMSVAAALSALPVNIYRVTFSLSIKNNEEVIFLQEVKDNLPEDIQDNIIHLIRRAVVSRYGIDLHTVVLVKANSLPKTPSGKLQRKKCQQSFEEGRLDVVNLHINMSKQENPTSVSKAKPPHLQDDVSRFQSDFVRSVANVLKIDASQINLTDSVSAYHFDSINLIQLTTVLNETFQLSLTPAILFEFTTLEEFVQGLLSQNRHAISQHYQSHPMKNKDESTTMKVILDDNLNTVSNPVNHKKDIAVIGMSGIFPGAADVDTFWQNLIEGRDVISEIPKDRWDWKKYEGDPQIEANKTNVKWGGFVDGIAQFDATFFNISPREAEMIDPQQRLFLQTAVAALEDAGISKEALSKVKTGLFVGAFSNDYAELLHQNGITDAYTTTGLIHSILANRVSYLLNLRGPSEAIDTACSSSLVALHHAVYAIQNGDCDVVIVGGVNALVTPSSYLSTSKAGMLSEDGRCKTFDSKANGYVRSEGVAAIILKTLSQAEKDGDPIYGVIKGSAVNHGGNVSSLTVPNPNAQADVIKTACLRAGIEPETISLIETHGTGTALGDPIEINGLKKAFSELSGQSHNQTNHYCGLGAVKSNIGHLESAAGMAGIMKVLLAMKHQTLPGNLHFNELNPYIELNNSPFYIVNKTKKWNRLKDQAGNDIPNRAGVSSFGFGGTNAHVILEEYIATAKVPSADHGTYLIAISAKTESAFQHKLGDLKEWLAKQTHLPTLSSLSYTLNEGRNHFAVRGAFIVASIAQLQHSLEMVLSNQKTNHFIRGVDGEDQNNRAARFNQIELNALVLELEANYAEPSYQLKLQDLAAYYANGYDLPWQKLKFTDRSRISLPTYPFAKDHYWVEAQSLLEPSDNFSPRASIKPQKRLVLSGNAIEFIQEDFIQHASELLKISPSLMDTTVSLTELGFDSIALKELAVKLEKQYAIKLAPSVFFTHKSIKAITHFLFENHPTEIMRIYAPVEANWVDDHEIEEISGAHASRNQREPIAVIGMQGLLPQSNNISEFWEHIEAGDDLVGEVPLERWDWRNNFGDAKQDTTKTNSKWGGTIFDVDKFDASFFKISAREANLMDPQQRLLMEIVWKTIEDAGYDPEGLSGADVGLFAGVEFSEYQTLIHAHKNIFHGHVATGTSHAMLANRISYFMNWHGPSEVIDTACSSSLVAVNRAVNALRNGECSVAIAGGVSLMLDPDTFVITSQLGALSPDGRCKTFDKSANGYVKGEGVVALMLKPLSQAQKDGDHVYGVIKATSVNHGGKAQSLTAPDASAQSQLLVKAYTQSGFDPQTVTYIEMHGTGTELGDPIEIEGLKQAFKILFAKKGLESNQTPFCGIGSVKTNIGHLEPASGIAGMIKVLLSMHHGKIPGNLHFKEQNPFIDLSESPFYIVQKTQEWHRLKDAYGSDIPRRAGVSSFGFGGTNAHVVLEEYKMDNRNKATVLHKPHYLITLSAKTADSLQQKIADLYEWLKHHFSKTNLESLSFTLNTGRTHFNVRCAMVVNSLDELLQSLQSLLDGSPLKNCLMSTNQTLNYSSPVFDEVYRSTLNTIENTAMDAPQLYREKCFILADLFTKNFAIDWQVIHKSESQLRVAGLPAYPFTKLRYWFDAELNTASEQKPTPILQIAPPISASIMDLQGFTQDYLKKVFAEKLRIAADQIATDATYEVYGVDSMLGLEITNRLEEDFGTLSKTLLYERSSIRDLSAYFLQKSHDKLRLMHADQNPSPVPANVNSLNLASETSIIERIVSDELSSSKEEDNAMKDWTGDIAIIGVSGVYPLAKDIDAFWENLEQGKDCVGEVPLERWDYKDYPVKVGDETKYFKDGGFLPDVDKFDPLFFSIAPRDAALMDPQERLFMQTCWATIEDAGYTRDTLQQKANNQVGVFAGVTYNFYPLFIFEEWQKGNRIPLDVQSFSIANRISYFLNLKGPSYVVDTACSSSLAAIHLACESIARGECTMAIAGGVNLSLHPAKYHMLGSYSFMSDQGRCASFAEGGAGYVPSEGVGAVLLKPLDLAIKDKDRIYGVIKSSAMNHGGKTSGYTVPNPNAQADLIKSALKRANINPRSISYIEAHGTGTSLGDPIEIRGLQDAFEESTHDKQFCAIGSVKSNIGHLESAAGISQLTKVLLQMQHKKLVASLHAEKLNPFIDFAQSPFYVQQTLSDWQPVAGFPRRAGVSSFGAGGTNVHLIVDEYIPAVIKNTVVAQGPFLFVLSAMNVDRLQAYAADMLQYLLIQEPKLLSPAAIQTRLSEVAYTTQVGREAMSARLAIVTVSLADLIEKLQFYIAAPQARINQLWFNPSAANHHKVDTEKLPGLLQASKLDEIAQLWVDGAKVNWQTLYHQGAPSRIHMPSYPFAKRRCWVPTLDVAVLPEVKAVEAHTIAPPLPVIVSSPEKAVETTLVTVTPEVAGSIEFSNDWFYKTSWQQQLTEDVSVIKNPADRWLIFSDKELGFLLQHELGINACLYSFIGNEYDELNSNAFYINPAKAGDYNQLLSRVLAEQGANLKGIIYLWPLSDESPESDASFKLLSTFQALAQHQWKTKLQFCLVTRGAQSIDAGDPVAICQRHLWSMARIFGTEQPDFQMQFIDLDPKMHLRQDARIIANEVMHLRHDDNHVAYRNQVRYVNRLQQVKSLPAKSVSWHAPETVIITGGLGALGTEVAKMLVSLGTKYFLLTGRSELPDFDQWKNLQEESLLQKTANVIALQKMGVEVRYAMVDVTDKVKMQTVIAETEKRWNKPIKGVFHLAGLATDNITLATLSPDILKRALDTKIVGALHLHELFQQTDLNCFVMFSSLAAVPFFGLSGLVADAAGNEFLTGLASERHRSGLPALTVNWSAWADVGMGHEFNHAAFLSAVGLKAVPVSLGILMLQHLLTTDCQNVIVMNVNWQKFFQVNAETRKLQFFQAFFDQQAESVSRKTQYEPVSRDHVTALLLNAAAKLLDLDVTELELDVPFQNYGMDSIIGINFIAEINEHFPDAVSPMDLYRYPSLGQLVGYLIEISQPESDEVIQSHKLELVETPDEDIFLQNIAHLDDEAVRQLLEDELSAIDEWH